MDSPPSYTTPRKVRKQRIPKACGVCRRSKLRCDGKRPCSRCRVSGKACEYVEPPNDANKIEALEKEVESLRMQLRQNSYSFDPSIVATSLDPAVSWSPITFPPFSQSDLLPFTASFDLPDINTQNIFSEPLGEPGTGPNLDAASLPPTPATSDSKWKGFQLEIDNTETPDFITAGILTTEQAEANLKVFFQGCGHYFPFIDPKHDSIQRLRDKSNILFNTICAVGCRARSGHRSHFWRILDTHVSRMHDILTTTGTPSVEMIQALLIRACYSSERSLLISMATRMALELGLPEAYNDLSSKIILGRVRAGLESPACDELLQKTRTWLSILVLRLMLGIDTGKSLDFNLYGDVRRYRILLDKPFSTAVDLCLLEQVELNVLRAKIYKSLTEGMDAGNDEGLMNAVRDARVDIDVWFNDWTRILNSQTQVSWLKINLEVQRHWADITTLCWAAHACSSSSSSGGRADATVSPTQRDMLLMAKNALRRHLQAVMARPRLYIHNLRFATDFVWAKFVFCFLLLLDLSILVVEDDDGDGDGRESRLDLLSHGNALLGELADAGGIAVGETCSHMSRDCLRILRDGIENYARCISGIMSAQRPAGGSGELSGLGEMLVFGPGGEEQQRRQQNSSRESFVPEQFVFEWKFPYPWLQPNRGELW